MMYPVVTFSVTLSDR